MALILVDTSVLIESQRAGVDLERFIDDDDAPAIAAITLAELQVGVGLATGRKRERRQLLFDEVVALFPVVDYDSSVAAVHARLLVETRRAGRPRSSHDLIIAASAVASGRLLLSLDARGFEGLDGVQVRIPER